MACATGKRVREIDIEDLNKKFQGVLSREFIKPTAADVDRLEPLICELLMHNTALSERQMMPLYKKHKFNGKRSFLLHVYLELKKRGMITSDQELREAILRKSLQIKPCKSWSGLVTITIFTAAVPEYTNAEGVRVAQSFTCNWSCSFCPNEPGQPRSYLLGEPAVLRANKNSFDCAAQIWDRMNALYMTGHNPTKCDIIVSGGTWTSYPKEYREEFCRDIYYAVNTFWSDDVYGRRPRMSLSDEKRQNHNSQSRIVGLTIETRPDTITKEELRLLRKFGVTRVQLGIQHTDDTILDKVNRRCPTEKTIEGIKLLKQNCYKISAHWMLNLPGSNPEKDDAMLNRVLLGTHSLPRYDTDAEGALWEHWKLSAPELSCDSWKIYPTAVTPWTDIEKWFHEGSYVPYDESDMILILMKSMSLMYPFIRLERVIRDIPESYMYNEDTGADNTNMRQELDDLMKADNIYCMDIRNREVKDKAWDGTWVTVVREFTASDGKEYFISAESSNKKVLYGFVRLRLDNPYSNGKAFGELCGCSLIREVHVYGDLTQVGVDGKHVQHKGIGRKLMSKAEGIAKMKGYTKAAVIAAEGNKEYYKKLGYDECEYFMIKTL